MTELPSHLADMALFKVNTGTREREVCALRWDWEHDFPELKVSVFVVPAAIVKNKQDRLIMLNDVATKVIDSRRGRHATHVWGANSYFGWNAIEFQVLSSMTYWLRWLDDA